LFKGAEREDKEDGRRKESKEKEDARLAEKSRGRKRGRKKAFLALA